MSWMMFATSTPQGNPLSTFSPVIMVVGVVSIGVLLTLSIRTKIARRNAAAHDPRQLIAQVRAERQPHNDLDAATAEHLDMTQRLAAQLEFKAQRLEQLMHQADRKIEQLEQLSGKIGPVPAAAAKPVAKKRTPPPRPAPPEPVADPLTASVYELADSGRDPADIARELDEHVGKVELILSLRSR